MTEPEPRLVPLPPEQWGEEQRSALVAAFGDKVANGFLATGPDAAPVPNAVGALMHHPALTGPFLVYNSALLRTPALDPRLRELAVLRVAFRTHADYEWAQHVRLAARIGITDEEIDAIAVGADAAGWSDLERDVLAAVDQLVTDYRMNDDTWERLAERLDERQLIELVFVVGTYTGLAMAFNSFGLELDEDLRPSATPSRSEIEE
ncbi:MAG TPA: carboxymuconolactone decarboxylase family protein [Acidimicrobiia bacterium]